MSREVLLVISAFFLISNVDAQVSTLCRPNERFLSCGGCQRTCSDPFPKCEAVCRVGCYCPDDEVRGEDGACVKLSDCHVDDQFLAKETTEPRPKDLYCPENEEYRFCETCNKTCDNPDPICPAQCARGCFCKGDMVRDIDGRCVNLSECLIQKNLSDLEELIEECPANEDYRHCEPCNRTCDDPNPVCPAQCNKGCYCKDGLYRTRNGTCVTLAECTSFLKSNQQISFHMTCEANQVYKECGSCEKTCTDLSPRCSKTCRKGCFCKEGLVKAPSGKCIPLKQCPQAATILGGMPTTSIEDCRSDEEYSSCGWCEPTCTHPETQCFNEVCISGCLCKPPLVRHRSGQCVERTQCVSRACKDPNEEYICKYGCESRCSSRRCLSRAGRCVRGCYCKAGWYRHSITHKCVKIEECNRYEFM